ncbi:MAG TPA: hypothetical protein VHL50_10815, partial [Pyrinomonadaceae bacterium]|nr:hypothetical protein [Pyrinomonadaceae bacterium]
MKTATGYRFLVIVVINAAVAAFISAQVAGGSGDEKASEIVARAIQVLGGDKYLNVKSQVGRGKFSVISGGAVVSFQSFVDVIVFPDK